MKTVIGLFALVSLVGCGSEQGASEAISALKATPAPANCGLSLDCPTPTTPAQVQEAIDPTVAFSITSIKEIPTCCAERDGALVYIKDTKTFMTCSENMWSAIDLKGVDGKDGTNGVDGKDGVNGKDGTNGVDGRDGIDGVDGAQGVAGAKGDTGAQGTQGLQGVAGAQGVAGVDGVDGVDGEDGAQGIQGVAGAAGSAGLSTGVRVVSEPSGANCAAGGSKVQPFTDTDNDGVYDAGESLLGAAAYVCNGDAASANHLVSRTVCTMAANQTPTYYRAWNTSFNYMQWSNNGTALPTTYQTQAVFKLYEYSDGTRYQYVDAPEVEGGVWFFPGETGYLSKQSASYSVELTSTQFIFTWVYAGNATSPSYPMAGWGSNDRYGYQTVRTKASVCVVTNY